MRASYPTGKRPARRGAVPGRAAGRLTIGIATMLLGRSLLPALACILFSVQAFATEAAIPDGTPDNIRAWFKDQRSPGGGLCCDLADGHVLDGDDVETKGDHYRVRIEGQWLDVPPDMVIWNHGNPNGGAVVWYGHMSGKTWIRCFVPGGGV